MTFTSATPTGTTFRVTRVRYQRDPRMDTLPSAVSWLAEHWNEQRTAPDKLHRHDTEGELGGLVYSPQFEAVLDWTPNSAVRWSMTTECRHPRLPLPLGQREHGPEARWDCPDCQGAGVREVTSDRYPYPMTTALSKLAKVPDHRGQPHPVILVHELASHGFRVRPTLATFSLRHEQGEALLLRAIRKLHGRYQAAPIHRSWVELSDSQRNAEAAA